MAPVRLKRFRCAPLADVSATLWCCLCCGVRVFLIYTCDVPARQTSSSHKRGAHWIAMQCGGKLMRFLLGAQQPNRLPPQEETASGVSGACQDVLEVRTRRTKRMHLETGCGIVGRLDRLGGSSRGRLGVRLGQPCCLCGLPTGTPDARAPWLRVFYPMCCPKKKWVAQGSALHCLPSLLLGYPISASSYPIVASSYPIVAPGRRNLARVIACWPLAVPDWPLAMPS